MEKVQFLADVFNEHLDEIAGLYSSRKHAANDRAFYWQDLSYFDDSREAHLDALAIAGQAALPAIQERLTTDDAAEWYAAAAALCRIGQGRDLLRLKVDSEPLYRAVSEAVSSELPSADETNFLDLAQRTPGCERVAAWLMGWRRKPSALLESYLRSADDRLATTAAWAFGRCGGRELENVLVRLCDTIDFRSSLHRQASLALLRTGTPLSCEHWLASEGAKSQPLLMGIAGCRQHTVMLIELLGRPEVEPASLLSLGLLGDLGSVDFLLNELSDSSRGRYAALALFCLLGPEQLRDPIEQGGFSDLEDEEEVDVDDPTVVIEAPETGVKQFHVPTSPGRWKQWWTEHRHTFSQTDRYVLGKPDSPSAWISLLDGSNSDELRRIAYEILAVRYRLNSVFETAYPVSKQIHGIESLRAQYTPLSNKFEPGGWHLAAALC